MSHCEEHAARRTGEEGHCMHDTVDGQSRVCCWCGDLFLLTPWIEVESDHGEHLPKYATVIADLKARLKACREAEGLRQPLAAIRQITDLRRKNWRKP